MPSVLAIVSKAIFERDGKKSGVGTVVPFERYVSKNKALAPAGEDGALFLVTVRPPDEALWLVGVLEKPKFDGEAWVAPKNTVPIRDISGVRDRIKFVTGAGISAKKGALGMSLQTPRILSDDDVALLRAGAGGAPTAAAPADEKRAGEHGHLNAHERSGPTPCLCRKCIADAPETFVAGGLTLVRDRASANGRFLLYWRPEALEGDRDAVRRAVENRMRERIKAQKKKKSPKDNLDEVFGGDDDEGDE